MYAQREDSNPRPSAPLVDAAPTGNRSVSNGPTGQIDPWDNGLLVTALRRGAAGSRGRTAAWQPFSTGVLPTGMATGRKQAPEYAKVTDGRLLCHEPRRLM